jgi:hypothetical protein
MTMPRRVDTLIDRAYLPLMAIGSAIIAGLNFNAYHGFHTIEKHLVFRERILHGFAITDVMPSYPTPPTFPMWGYGWVLLLTTNKAALIAIQIAVALFSAWHLLRTLDEFTSLHRSTRTLLRVLMALCTPWYAYNSIDWSQSLATSFLILSISLLTRVVHTRPNRSWLALSGVCLGLNLNLASDLYLLPVALAAAYWIVGGFSRQAAAQATAWFAIVMLTLVPWMIYTWHATGTPLMKSTNQGHVLLIGLGQDPQKRFGITYSDGDPVMYQTLARELGDGFAHRFYASCAFEADPVLKRKFIEIVRRQPLAYIDLVGYRLRSVLAGHTGTYDGEFDEGQNVNSFGVSLRVRRRVRNATREAGHLLQRGTTVLAPFTLWIAIRRRQPALAFALVTVAYQYLSCSVAVMQPQYVSNLIVLQLLVCATGLEFIVAPGEGPNAPVRS